MFPGEIGVRTLRRIRHQVIAPVIGRQDFERRIHEDAALAAGGEFSAVIVQPVEALDLVDQLPRLARAHDGDGKADGVERDIVLAHELDIADVGGSLAIPPVLPRIGFAGGIGPFARRADIFDGRIEPDVEHLALELAVADIVGHRHAPVEIARDAAIVAALRPAICGRWTAPAATSRPHGRRSICAVAARNRDCLRNRCALSRISMSERTRQGRARVVQIGGIEHAGAVLALVAARALIAAIRTGADDIAIRQEALFRVGIDLPGRAHIQMPGLPQGPGQFLGQGAVLEA